MDRTIIRAQGVTPTRVGCRDRDPQAGPEIDSKALQDFPKGKLSACMQCARLSLAGRASGCAPLTSEGISTNGKPHSFVCLPAHGVISRELASSHVRCSWVPPQLRICGRVGQLHVERKIATSEVTDGDIEKYWGSRTRRCSRAERARKERPIIKLLTDQEICQSRADSRCLSFCQMP